MSCQIKASVHVLPRTNATRLSALFCHYWRVSFCVGFAVSDSQMHRGPLLKDSDMYYMYFFKKKKKKKKRKKLFLLCGYRFPIVTNCATSRINYDELSHIIL